MRLEPLQQPYLHPGRAARILIGADGVRAGEIGELHPSTAARFDLEGRVAVLELDLDLLAAAVPAGFRYAPVPDQPPVLQDIAVVVDDSVPAEQLIAAARSAGAPLLTHVGVFDVYRDERRLGAGKVSLATAPGVPGSGAHADRGRGDRGARDRGAKRWPTGSRPSCGAE